MDIFEEIFRDFGFNDSITKGIQKHIVELEKGIRTGKLEGKWNVQEINKPGVKEYIVQFWSNEPPINPLNPLEPQKRRPMPKRPFQVTETAYEKIREPLTDVFEEDKFIKIYVELPGEEKDDIRLNITKGQVEIKARNFYKAINIPEIDSDIEKASSKYKNDVLEVIIPKKNTSKNKKKQKIMIE